MQRLIAIIALALMLGGCEVDDRGAVTPTNQPAEDVNYHVKFLFEVDGVKMYQFMSPGGRTVYFTVPPSRTYYQHTATRHAGKSTYRTTYDVECLNTPEI